MGATTAISWTDASWNPWHGCTRVSPGCAHCYMYRDKERYGQDPTLVQRSKTKFREPLSWKEPKMIFTCSWSDWFHEAADEWRDEAWEIIRQTPQHTYQILTKRPERIADHLPADWGRGWSNVWLGTSAENDHWLHMRVSQLLRNHAAVHFVSAEPLLGPLSFTHIAAMEGPYTNWLKGEIREVYLGEEGLFAEFKGLDWVIVGGESGPKARPIKEDWVRDILAQCREAGVAFFLKQWGGSRPGGQAHLDGKEYHEFPAQHQAPGGSEEQP